MEENNNKINNVTEELNKSEEKKKSKGITLKKVIATAACVTIVLGGSQIYASTQGYQNIFFMIKDIVSSSKYTNNRDEILSDRDITISYKPIEIAKGIKIQVNRLVVKDNTSGLYLQVQKTEEERNTSLTFKVNDGDGNKLGELSSYSSEPIYTADIWLPNYRNDINELELKINKDSEELATLKIDLVNREIKVFKNQEDDKKISEEDSQMNENEATQILRDKFLELGDLYTEPDKYFTKGNDDTISNYEQVLNNTFLNDGKKEFENNLPAMIFKSGGKIYMRNIAGMHSFIADLAETDSFKNIVISNNKITATVVTFNSVAPGSQDHEYRESRFAVVKNGDKWLIDEFDAKTIIEFSYEGGDMMNQEQLTKYYMKKQAIKEYLELVGAKEGSSRAVLEKLGLISNVYGDSENIITSDNFVKTDIKYSDYKNAMMNYMTEDCFNKNFTGGYRNINGVLYYFNGGGSGIEYEVGDIISENENNVTVQVYNVHVDGSKELENMTFGISYIGYEDHMEYVISSVL